MSVCSSGPCVCERDREPCGPLTTSAPPSPHSPPAPSATPRALLGQELCSRPLGAHHPEGVSLRPQLTAEARGRGPLRSPRGSLGPGKAVGVFFRAGCSGLAPSGLGGLVP